MRYTLKGLKALYANKYLDVYGFYNYKSHCWEFEVRGVSDEIRENYQTISEIEEGNRP